MIPNVEFGQANWAVVAFIVFGIASIVTNYSLGRTLPASIIIGAVTSTAVVVTMVIGARIIL